MRCWLSLDQKIPLTPLAVAPSALITWEVPVSQTLPCYSQQLAWLWNRQSLLMVAWMKIVPLLLYEMLKRPF